MKNSEFYKKYGENLSKALVKQCSERGVLDGKLLVVDELSVKWSEVAPEYMSDAMPQFAQYPAVSLAWAAYLGMGMAKLWDVNWDELKSKDQLYSFFATARGFDSMDEYIIEDVLKLSLTSKDAVAIENMLRSCAHSAISIMRRENLEPQSVDAFYIFAETVKVFFNLGASIELKYLGYKYEKVLV